MQFAETDPLIFKIGSPTKATKRKGYWFPYKFKYVAWFIVLAVIVICSVFLVLYGLTFGLIKCYLWITAVLMSIITGLAVIQPTKIFLMSYGIALIVKSPPSLQFKKIPESILQNSYDERRAFLAHKRRLDNTPYYTPIPKYKLENRAQNIKYHLEQRKLFVDFIIFLVFVMVLSYIVVIHKSWADYYSTEVVKHLIIHGSYTNSIPFEEVSTYRQFIEYLNLTLFPSLFGSSKRDSKEPFIFVDQGRNRNGKKKRQNSKNKGKRSTGAYEKISSLPVWDEESMFVVRERFLKEVDEAQKNITNIYERSWTLDRSVKMIGKPRMRQLRVKNNTCKGIKQIKPRENLCFAEFNLANQEKGNYYLWWRAVKDEVLTPKEQKPWIYQSSWKTGAIYLISKYSSYPAGGYILEFAKNLDDCRVILNYMDAFQWIDARTRAVIIEFTLYSVNVNLFNVVHLIAERSASGYFITSYQIDTAKFMFLASELEIISIVMLIVFDALLLLFLYREAIRIERTSFKSYITEGKPTVDILIIILGSLSVIFIFLRTHYVTSLLLTLDRSQNYEYVSFAYAAIWDNISTYINATLIILAAIKLFQLLRFRVIFLQFQETLRGSCRYFAALGLQLFTVLIAFTFLFHLVLMPYDYDFSTFGLTLSTLIGRAFCLDDSYDFSVFANTPWFVAPLFYVLFIIFIMFLILNFFISVICFYLSRVKSTQIRNKYNAIAYLKHILTASNKTDIMRLRGGCFSYDNVENSPLRLRGGGAACGRICLGNQEEYAFPPKYGTSNELIKRGQPTFTKVKVYDFSRSYRLEDLHRFEAMKRITKAELETDRTAKAEDRELAMKVLVARRLDPPTGTSPEKYYAVVDRDEKTIVSTGRLAEMRKIVDNYGREKLVQKYRDVGINLKIVEDDVEDYSQTLKALDKKFSELRVVVDKKYAEERRRKSKERKKARASKPDGSVHEKSLSEIDKEAEKTESSLKEDPTAKSKKEDPEEPKNQEDENNKITDENSEKEPRGNKDKSGEKRPRGKKEPTTKSKKEDPEEPKNQEDENNKITDENSEKEPRGNKDKSGEKRPRGKKEPTTKSKKKEPEEPKNQDENKKALTRTKNEKEPKRSKDKSSEKMPRGKNSLEKAKRRKFKNENEPTGK